MADDEYPLEIDLIFEALENWQEIIINYQKSVASMLSYIGQFIGVEAGSVYAGYRLRKGRGTL